MSLFRKWCSDSMSSMSLLGTLDGCPRSTERMQQEWVTTSFNTVCVYPLRIVENGSTLTTEMDPPPLSRFHRTPSPAAQLRSVKSTVYTVSIEAVGATQHRSVVRPPLPPMRTYVVALAPTWLFCLDVQGNPQGPVRRDFEGHVHIKLISLPFPPSVPFHPHSS